MYTTTNNSTFSIFNVLRELELESEMLLHILVTLSVLFIILVLLWIVLRKAFHAEQYKIFKKHILITGGSSGIGFAVATAAIKRGAGCITIIARNKALLEEASAEVKKYSKDNQVVQYFSLDVSVPDIDVIQDVIDQSESVGGPVDVLINCAGTSMSRSFTQTSLADFRKMMDVNYFGTVHMCKCVLDGMMKRNSGRVVITSSVAGHLGLYGYSAYSASKFALRGLAECLQMEVQPYDINVSLVFPPDTDTPGYKLEQIDKSEETHLISEYGGLFRADDVAQVMLDAVERGAFLVPVGFDGWVMSSTSCGMTAAPPHQIIAQVLLSGLFRLVSLFYLYKFNNIVKACTAHRRQTLAHHTDKES